VEALGLGADNATTPSLGPELAEAGRGGGAVGVAAWEAKKLSSGPPKKVRLQSGT